MYEELVKRLLSYEDLHCPLDRAAGICGCIDAREAAEAILELSREVDMDNAAMTAMDAAIPRWIPVTERLPEDGRRALVMRFDYVTNTPFYDLLWFDKGEWWNRHFRGDYAVTHWMRLPEPPKGE